MKRFKTSFFEVGDDCPAYVIAEIGSNHNGDFDLALELIDKAAEAGVNAVKFQTFKASSHYSSKTKKISLYEQDIYSLIENLEIDRSWHQKLNKHCLSLGIDFLDSPCDKEAVMLAESVDMPMMKVASFDMVDVRLVDLISQTGKAVLFSTGMANMAEIERAVNICRANENHNIAVLQCTSMYPAPCYLSNLRAMNTIKNAFDVIVGYSDHTIGDHIPVAAVSLGAKIIEKHYTLNRNMTGPDHCFAIEPQELRVMVEKIREVESAFGDGMKNGPREEEKEFFENARRSIIAVRDIKEGEVIQNEDLIIKRPNYGIHPSQIKLVVGRVAKQNISLDDAITWDMI